jgi:hypothetical protein
MKKMTYPKNTKNNCLSVTAFCILFMIPIHIFSQSILNGNFENWSSTNYDKLVNWENSNRESIPATGSISVSKTSDSHSGFAIKIKTVSSSYDTIAGYFINTPGDPLGGEGGFPYSAKPSKITGYYKYNLSGNDTALILVIFKSVGTIVSTDVFKIRGTGQQTNYTFFNFPLSLSVMPDTVIIAASSSNVIGEVGIEPGSTLYLDELAFTGSGTMPAINNGNCENWVTTSYDQLSGWDCSLGNLNIIKTTDSYKGTYALELLSTKRGSGSEEVGSITSGQQTDNGTYGGLPFSNQVDTVFGYYKYFNNSGDHAIVTVQFFSNGINIGGDQLELNPSASYVKFQLPFSLPVAPDTMRIDISSSKWPFSNIGNGSTLYIDEIQLASAPLYTGFRELNTLKSFSIYPNPAKKQFTVDLNEFIKKADITVLDITGKAIYRITAINSQKLEINIPDMKVGEGVYWVSVQTDDRVSTKKIIISNKDR